MFAFLFEIILFLQQTAETIAPVVIPLVIFALAIFAAYGFSLSGSRTVTVIGATAALYAALAPQLSSYTSMPNWLRVTFIVVGIVATTLNERLQGGKSVASILLCLVLLSSQLACSSGLITGFRVGMRATLPFVATLVTEGVISQAVADAVTADISEGIDKAVQCDQCLKAISSSVTGRSRQLAKAKCYLALAQNLRGILDRHHIGGVEQLERIARIVEAGVEAFEEYAREIGGGESPSAIFAGADNSNAPANADAESKLKNAVKKLKDDLREATKSPEPGKTGKYRYLIPNNSDFLLAQ